jgi:alkylation response protein AidB-like acyl-CoA dehydrogenase
MASKSSPAPGVLSEKRPASTQGSRPLSRRTRNRSGLSMREFGEQLEGCAVALAEGLNEGDLSRFYATFRATDLPFLLRAHLENPRGLFQGCFEVIHRLGSISPAVALAVENHYYVSGALATFRYRGDPGGDSRRRALLRLIVEDRLLVANTNSRVHTAKVGSLGTVARPEEGGFRVSGAAAYMSLASEGDLIFLLTQIENFGPAIFAVPLRGNPQIEVGPLLFPQAMVDSDTRRVTFRDAFLPADNLLLTGKDETMGKLGAFQSAWHQGLISAPFLGAAIRALEEGRRFLRSVNAPNGKPLAELDGMITEMGRMAIRYRAACGFARRTGEALEASALHNATLSELGDVFELACAAKHVATNCAEEIVTAVRRIVGGRAFTGGHPLERLSQEVMFGPLGGEVHAFIERRYGRRVLGEADLLTFSW